MYTHGQFFKNYFSKLAVRNLDCMFPEIITYTAGGFPRSSPAAPSPLVQMDEVEGLVSGDSGEEKENRGAQDRGKSTAPAKNC